MTSVDTHNAISSPELADGALPFESQNGMTLDLFGQVVAPASHSAAQESKKATAMSATYGRIGQGSSASADLQRYLESRLREQLPSAGGMMWPQIWKRKATPALRRYCQLAVSASPTSGTDCGLWPTPTVNAQQGGIGATPSGVKAIMENNPYRKSGHRMQMKLTDYVVVAALWATPNTMDGMGDRSVESMREMMIRARKGRSAPSNLREQVNPSMWPSPNAGDDRDRGRWENPSIQRRVTMGKQINLSMTAQGSNGSPAQTESKGQLNPEFVSWLMGYSTEHHCSMATAMQSFRKLPRRSSKQLGSA